MNHLTSSIQSALSCSQVALRLWENPYNKVCGDCCATNPEWASVNLLLVVCQNCAGLSVFSWFPQNMLLIHFGLICPKDIIPEVCWFVQMQFCDPLLC